MNNTDKLFNWMVDGWKEILTSNRISDDLDSHDCHLPEGCDCTDQDARY